MNYLFLSILCSFLTLSLIAQSEEQQAVELGEVKWLRDYDKAVGQSRQTGKPILILFQEVPGCHTCRKYGKQVLSHPLIVEGVERYFVPLAIFNNKGGADREVLERFGEPSWNNPVVRIVNDSGTDIVPRLSDSYHPAAFVETMKVALELQDAQWPEWLELVLREERAKINGTETAYLGMYCFWTGEKEIGGIEGVVNTEAGFMNGGEVVEVTYDPKRVELEKIVSNAARLDCADEVYAKGSEHYKAPSNFRTDSEPKYYLSKTAYAALPMTELQKVKVNRSIGKRQSPDKWLSPGQLNFFHCLKEQGDEKNRIAMDFRTAWNEVDGKCD